MTDDVNMKINILKKGIIDERRKISELQQENNSLKEKLSEKEELIIRLQNEVRSLNNGSYRQEGLSYYDSLLLNQSNSSSDKDVNEEYEQLQNELSYIKEENSFFQEQNSVLNTQLNTITLELNNMKKDLNTQIQQLEQQLTTMLKAKEEHKTKLQTMTELYNEFDSKKTSYESQIKKLSLDNQMLSQQLSEQNEQYTKQINILSVTVQHLMEDIEIKTNDLEKLKQAYEDSEIIEKDFHFKGTIYTDDNELKSKRGKVEVYFGKYAEAISLTINGAEYRIAIQDVVSFRKSSVKNTVLKLTYKEENKDKDLLIAMEFTERECKYILQYYNELKDHYNKINNKIMMLTFGDYSY